MAGVHTTADIEVGLEPVDQPKPDPGDLTLWSVTTIIGVLDKPALLYWAAEQTALAAVRSANSLPARIDEDGEAETVRWLRDARFRSGKDQLSATSLGTVVHAACETYVLTEKRPGLEQIEALIQTEAQLTAPATHAEAAVVNRMIDRFDEFLSDFQPAYQAAEVTVYSPTFGYAGTSDAFLTVDGIRLIVDYKTSRESLDGRGRPKGPYPEVALQLAAYRYAAQAAVWRPRRYEKFRRRYYLLSTQEQGQAVPPPEVDGGAVIHLSPDRYGFYPVRCDRAVHKSFLYVMEAARYVMQESKTVIGEPMSVEARP
jgi:hypothetical protein